MTDEAERAQARLERIADMKAGDFISSILGDAVTEKLVSDNQLGELVLLSEQARQLVELRGRQVGYDDMIRSNVAKVGELFDNQIHQRANELIASVCASIVRQDDRWIADNPDSVGMTEIHAMEDAIHEAIRWLDDHEDVVDRLGLSYPDDKW